MSAAEHLNSQQFALVPTKAVGAWLSDDSLQGEDRQVQAHRLNAMKRRSPQYPAVRDDIAKNGFRNPLFASSMARPGPVLDDGHHRLAAAYELGISHVPMTVDYLRPHELPAGTKHPDGTPWRK